MLHIKRGRESNVYVSRNCHAEIDRTTFTFRSSHALQNNFRAKMSGVKVWFYVLYHVINLREINNLNIVIQLYLITFIVFVT